MNMEKMKEKGKKKGTVKKFLRIGSFDDLFWNRSGLFFRLCYNKDSESIYAGRSQMARQRGL